MQKTQDAAASSGEDYRLPGLPRYVRVNTLKIGRGAAEKKLKETGHFHAPDPKHPGHRAYFRDPDVPDLLVFKPKGQSDISRVPMVATGEVVVQQKASCFPAVALAPPEGGTVIDACAAPGNKTSHVAALMGNRGKVIAFEQNERRCELLREMMKVKGATIVTSKHASFLDADPSDPEYASVTHIMLDPSCSSSGMSRTPRTDPDALRQLADDQEALVLHAMRFPAVVAIVYSTCSVHEMENECVVRNVLSRQKHFGLVPVMPWWARRGHTLDAAASAAAEAPGKDSGKKAAAKRAVDLGEVARCCVRSTYPDDNTIGFFLSRFERRSANAEHAAIARSVSLDEKLENLARQRAKSRKRGRDEIRGGGGGAGAAALSSPGATAAAEATEAGSSLGAGSQRAAASQAAIPQWRLERDQKKKLQRKGR